MKLSFFKVPFAAIVAVALSFVNTANAGIINGSLNTDNEHWVYISTADNVEGTLVSTLQNWKTTDIFSSLLVSGTDYFLHVKAKNITGPAAFIGEFNLDGTEHLFGNGLDTVVTNTSDWGVSSSGWSGYALPTSQGANGDNPWGNYASSIDASANWIWDSSYSNNEIVYFSIAINAVDVPEPTSLAVLGLALLGFGARRFKK